MLAVIQCAATKQPGAGCFIWDGRPVKFVDDPSSAPNDTQYFYAHPDDQADQGKSWRDLLLDYNQSPDNPPRRFPAGDLYRHEVYRELVEHYGTEKTFILSAGWGLIRSDFLTPVYDITYSRAGTTKDKVYKRRRQEDLRYKDFCQLPRDADERMVFFGGKDYLPLFRKLTKEYLGPITVYYRTESPPCVPGCSRKRYEIKQRTTWYYQCARSVILGKIKP